LGEDSDDLYLKSNRSLRTHFFSAQKKLVKTKSYKKIRNKRLFFAKNSILKWVVWLK